MQDSIALQRYLERHIAPDLPDSPASASARWQHCLIIPAFDESPDLLALLQPLANTAKTTLVILVLNRPNTEIRPERNEALRRAVHSLPPVEQTSDQMANLVALAPGVDLLLFDLELLAGPSPAHQGVGLARKYGCDIALKWMWQGAIASDWLCCSDADARLPADYFQGITELPTTAVAASLPFSHSPGNDPACDAATALYELRLHHYVLGLEYAGSPYAYHTLGSSMAVRAEAYAAVRGFPRRAGGEDFYLLNKLAKVGNIARPGGDCIELESRPSHRVPFGTGPAANGIADSNCPEQLPLFYHPQCFHTLRCLLKVIPLIAEQPDHHLAELLRAESLEDRTREAALQALSEMGLEAALAHCYRQGRTSAQFLRQFHQWFDGFRTLKFIHAMREAGWRDQPLAALNALRPTLWPTPGPEQESTEPSTVDVTSLRTAVRKHLGWHSRPSPRD